MANINLTVSTLLARDSSIQKDMARKIINNRALARYIIKKYSLNASMEGVISAVRRFNSKGSDEDVTNIFRGCTVSTRNNFVSVTLKALSSKAFSRFVAARENLDIGSYKLIMGNAGTKVIVENEYAKEVMSLFHKGSILEVERGLGEVSICLSREAFLKKGTMAKITNEISLHDINIFELIACEPEIIIYVKEDSIVNAHRIILGLKEAEFYQ